MTERDSLLLKNDGKRYNIKDLSDNLGAYQLSKSRRRLLIGIVAIVISILTVTLFLLTAAGCVISITVKDGFENAGIFLKRDVLRMSYQRYRTNSSKTSTPKFTDKTLRIVLLGDSMINKPYEMYNLGGKIQSYLSQYPYTLEITNCGFNGAIISDIMKDPLNVCALPLKPHAVILFWDSDCSNIQEHSMSDNDIDKLHAQYAENVAGVVNSILSTGAFVALTGTGVLGEGKKLFAPYWQSRFQYKEDMLDTYNQMNELVASDYHIPFINMRQAFLDASPFYQLCYSKCVTFDGEHVNARGTDIVAKLFSATLSEWLSSS